MYNVRPNRLLAQFTLNRLTKRTLTYAPPNTIPPTSRIVLFSTLPLYTKFTRILIIYQTARRLHFTSYATSAPLARNNHSNLYTAPCPALESSKSSNHSPTKQALENILQTTDRYRYTKSKEQVLYG